MHLIETGVAPSKIVAITFTNKAAEEMKQRLLHLPVLPFIGTFHSFSAAILRKEARRCGRQSNFLIFDDDDSMKIIKRLCLEANLSPTKYSPARLRWQISKIKNNFLRPEDEEEPIRLLFQEYEAALRRLNAFDFDDLIEKVVRLFLDEPAVLDKYRRRYRYILVDEYQDINPIQYLLLKLLAETHRNLNVVGDDGQAIYRFRWSDFTNFLNFEKDWPGAKIVVLGENYRSSANIVRAAEAVIKNNKLQRPKNLWTSNETGELIRIIGNETAEEEAAVLVQQILAEAETERDIAVLYRTNAQSRALEQALSFNALPYEIFGGLKFYERKEIKDLLAGLRYALNPQDELSRERLEKTFKKSVSQELLAKLPRLAKKLELLELIGFFLKETAYFDYLGFKFENAEERIENVTELIRFASGFGHLSQFLERVALLQPTDRLTAETAKPIKLMTIHLAKGLEFESVYLVGANEGLLPHERSLQQEEDIEEERRLMYVAMTRAKKKLTISFYGLASRFLYEIPPELINYSAGRDTWLTEEKEIYLD
jgi:DNA helicase-2/ATP-dependent DNA helicase PcrA